jgi:predicted SAM-dependent methyltransferase
MRGNPIISRQFTWPALAFLAAGRVCCLGGFARPVLHQRSKDLVFLLLAKATLPNYWLKRSLDGLSRKTGGARHLHLGSGPKYLPGFINIDANPRERTDLWLDVRCGLPYRDASVDSIYTTHMFEHLYPDELQNLLRECVRVLKPGAGMRIVVPSLASAIAAYCQKRENWFDAWPLKYESWGGKFSNYVFCSGQHRTAFDFEYLAEVLRTAGFREIIETGEGSSRLYGDRVPSYEKREEIQHSLSVECFAGKD